MALYIANMGDDTISIIDTGSLQEIGVISLVGTSARGIRGLIYNKGLLYATGAYDDSVTVIDTYKRQVIGTYNCVGKYPVSICAKDEYLYVCCCDSDSIHVIESNSGECLSSIHVPSYLTEVILCGGSGAVCGMCSKCIYLLELPTLKVTAKIPLSYTPYCILYDKRWGCIYVCGTDDNDKGVLSTIRVLKDSLQHIKDTYTGKIPVAMCICNDNLVVSCLYNDVICMHQRASINLLKTIQTTVLPGAICADKKQNLLFVASQLYNNIAVIDITTGEKIKTIAAGKEPVAMVIV